MSTPVSSVSEVNEQLASAKLSDQDETRPPADATVGDTKPKADPDLWKPHPPTEECPVCLVPLPLENEKSAYWACCGKLLCSACVEEHYRAQRMTDMKREKKKQPPLEFTCAFCRSPVHGNDSELISRYEKRVKKGDTYAMIYLAYKYRDGSAGFRRDEVKAFELLQMAADLGSADAIGRFGSWAVNERSTSISDYTKAMKYFEKAAAKGHVLSRTSLAALLAQEGENELAIKH